MSCLLRTLLKDVLEVVVECTAHMRLGLHCQVSLVLGPMLESFS